ncbi:MAG: YbaB/EbfC family nucleoid-associated protein [Eubacteriales bacterium]|nr:YbaB/EbfC family nucleoid-associated protein [Eubacteriales bacterium]
MAKGKRGFRPPMGGGNMNQLMAQAQKMQKQLEQAQAEAAEFKAEASAGGGMVTATVNADHQVEAIEIKAEIVDPDDVEMLEDMVLAAVNEAMRKLDEQVNAHLQNVSGLGGLGGMMGF